jgi:acyl dehydratase
MTTTITTLQQLKEYVGQELQVGEWHLVTQEEIDRFAEAIDDHQWIHVDQERARNGPFGATIAHGFWTLCTARRFLQGGVQLQLPSRMGINYGLNRVRFPNVVRVGSRIRTRTTLLSAEEVQPGVIQQITQVTVEIEGEAKPAMVAESLTRLYL